MRPGIEAKAIHAVNAVLWHPDKQTQITNGQTNKQTNQLLYPWPPTCALGNYGDYLYCTVYSVIATCTCTLCTNFLALINLFLTVQAEENHTIEITCKPSYHRFLIGRGGANIRKVRDKFGARVMFPQKSSEEDCDVVTIIGRKEKAEAAKEHLLQLIQDLVSVRQLASD